MSILATLPVDRSALFTAYNRGRRAAREGRIERRRLDRALGLAQRKAASPNYRTDLRACSCPDFSFRGARIHFCKHQLALALRRRTQLAAAQAEMAA